MRSEKIEDILNKHGVEQSDKLAAALEEILQVYSSDPGNIKTIQEGINRNQNLNNRSRGIL